MERKAFHALLLSGIVAAGAMTISSDAYAQTNTDRLIAVEANTDGLPGMLEAILDAIEDGVASILAAIAGVQTDVDDGLQAIDEDLMVIDADLASIHGDLSAIDGDLQSIHGDLSAIDGDLQSIHGDLTNMDADLVNIHEDLTTVHGDLEHLDEDIQTLTQTVNAMGQASSAIAGLAESNAATSAGVQSNSAAINELKGLLEGISENLGVVQNKTTIVEAVVTAEEEEMAVAAAAPTRLITSKTEVKVRIADFAGDLKEADSQGKYDATNAFSCDGDVFITQVSSSSHTNFAAPDDATAQNANTIHVNGIRLYNSDLDTGDNSLDTYNIPIIYANQYLPSGMELEIVGNTNHGDDNLPTADHDNDNTNEEFSIDDYANTPTRGTIGTAGQAESITKSNAGLVVMYEVEVNWFKVDPATTCSISAAVGATAGLDEKDDVLVSLSTVTTDTRTIKALVSDDVSCNDKQTEITNITIEAGILHQYTKITLESGTEKETYKFDATGNVTNADDLPFRFSGQDLTVSGESVADVLIQLEYATIDGNDCEVPDQ